jgi:hypothetical protein
MTSRFTVVRHGGADEIDATVDEAAATVRLSAQAVHRCFGWERKNEGLCRDEVCIPARRLAGIEGDDGRFDLDGLAALLTRPIAIDIDARAAFVGVSAPTRAAPLARFEAPDFTLPDLDGRLYTLSDHRGKKVFLATWASW